MSSAVCVLKGGSYNHNGVPIITTGSLKSRKNGNPGMPIFTGCVYFHDNGISSISEHYNRRMDEAFAGIQGIRKIVDDVVVFDKDEQHVEHVREILRRCDERGISLNRDKFKFCRPQAHFSGFMLTSEGYSIMQ